MIRYSHFPVRAMAFLLLALGSTVRAETLIYHEIKTDATGKIVPWYGTGPSQAYDHDIRLLFDFLPVKSDSNPSSMARPDDSAAPRREVRVHFGKRLQTCAVSFPENARFPPLCRGL